MRIQAYTRYAGTISVTAATLRSQTAPSVIFTNATIHEDYAAKVRALLEEHIHIPPNDQFFPPAVRLQNYFPAPNGAAIYVLKELMPAGAPRSIDAQFMLEVTSIRYAFVLDLLPAAYACTGQQRSAIERAMEYAFSQLFAANGVPNTFIPGDQAIRPENPDTSIGGTDIDIICQLGAASARGPVEIPGP